MLARVLVATSMIMVACSSGSSGQQHIDIDHRNHNGLDCQRKNLRRCVRGENTGNLKKYRGVSKYKGVSWDKARQSWRACIRVHGVNQHLGRFTDEADAGRAYDAAARAEFGEFCYVNFPESLA